MSESALEQSLLEQGLLEHYRWFHRHPEPSYEEHTTTARIRRILESHSVEILNTGLKTGLVAVIRGTQPGPVIALRGDIDGLPITENTGLPYASEHAGYMHGCGHDFNLTVALGAAIELQAARNTLAGTIKVIFQPAEEGRVTKERPTGAVQVLNTGALDDVQAFFGTHDAPGEVGAIYIKEGGTSGAVDKFAITVTGHGTHAAEPTKGDDVIVAVAAIVQSLQTVVSRSIDPVHPAVLSVTHIEAGNTWNVLPSTAFLEGTVRTTERADRQIAKDRAVRIVENTAAAYGVSADVQWFFGSPSVDNDPHWAEVGRKIADENGLETRSGWADLGGEDFSYYLDRAPGLFVRIGAGDTNAPHGPTFAPDPHGIISGVRFLTAIAQRALAELNETTPTHSHPICRTICTSD